VRDCGVAIRRGEVIVSTPMSLDGKWKKRAARMIVYVAIGAAAVLASRLAIELGVGTNWSGRTVVGTTALVLAIAFHLARGMWTKVWGRAKVIQSKDHWAAARAEWGDDKVECSMVLDGEERPFYGEPYFLEDAIWVRGGIGCDFAFVFKVPAARLASLLTGAGGPRGTAIDPPCGWLDHHKGYSAADMGAWTHPIEALEVSARGEEGVLVFRAMGVCGPIDRNTVEQGLLSRCLKGHRFELEVRFPFDQVANYLAPSMNGGERQNILEECERLGRSRG
jgi:hypothetical protein